MFRSSPKLEDTMFTLKFSMKQMERMAKKCEKEENAHKAKLKKAIEKKNVDVAKVYAENAIRKKNEGLNYLRMAARVDAVHSRINSAMMMKQVGKQMGSVIHGLDRVMQSMDLEKISAVMEKFESQFEDLDVHEKVLEGAMGAATTLSTPQDQVDQLIHQVAEENGLEIISQLDTTETPTALPTGTQSLSIEQEDQLTRRLARLRDAATS